MYIENKLFTCPNTLWSNDTSNIAKFSISTTYMPRYKELVTAGVISSDTDALVDSTTGDITSPLFMVQRVHFDYSDVHKVDPNIGDVFHIHYLGMAPMLATISGNLIETEDSGAKSDLMLLYTEILRASKVAVNKVIPTLCYLSSFMEGCILSIELTESVKSEGVIFFNMQYQVLRLYIVNTDNSTEFGYTNTNIEFLDY